MPDRGRHVNWRIQQLPGVTAVCWLDHGDHSRLTDTLPWQAQHESIELLASQRRVRQRRPDEASLMQPTAAQPYADAVVHENLEPITATVGEDVSMMRACRAEDGDHASKGCVGSGSHIHGFD